MSRRSAAARFAILAVVVAGASTTAAQDHRGSEETPSDPSRAAELTRQALELYEAGDPEAAIPLLLEARAHYPEPLILYNLARAYEALGRDEDALAAYEQYVDERPDAPDRAAMETHIRSLRAQIDERERLENERDEERRRHQEAEARAAASSGPGPWPWLLLATGGAAVGTGVVLGLVAQSERDAAVEDPVHETTVATMERAETMATAANILFVAGGVLAATGATWLIVDAVRSGSPDDASLSLGVVPGGVVASGRF